MYIVYIVYIIYYIYICRVIKTTNKNMEHEITAQPVYNKKGQVVSGSIKLSNTNLVAGKKYKIIIL